MPAAADAPPADEHLATMANAVGAAVARQLGAHLTDLMKRFDDQVAAAHRTADRIRTEVTADVDHRFEILALQLANQRDASESYQRTMLDALESRLVVDIRALHVRLDAAEAGPLHAAAGTAAAVTQLRATIDERTAALRAQVDAATASSADAGASADAVRALVETTKQDVDARLADLDADVSASRDAAIAATAPLQALVDAQRARIDDVDTALSASGGRFDDVSARIADVSERLGRLDEHLLDQVREELSTVVGEATLARIEMDRLTTSTDAKLDRHGLRMAEIEAQLADDMDTSAAVQLERLDELERAVAELDPDQFVRRQPSTDPTASRAS